LIFPLIFLLLSAFCAIIHRYRPDLINFNSLNKDEPLKNHELGNYFKLTKILDLIIYAVILVAFSVAENLGIPPLLDPEDMLVAPTPEVIIFHSYLSNLYFNERNLVRLPRIKLLILQF
jgi:hypothetical protein